MQEYRQNGNGADKAHGKQINAEQCASKRLPIGELVFYHLFRHEPPKEYAGQQSADGKEYLPRNKVEQFEQRFSSYLQAVQFAERKGTENTYNAGKHSNQEGSFLPCDVEFLIKKRRTYLV